MSARITYVRIGNDKSKYTRSVFLFCYPESIQYNVCYTIRWLIVLLCYAYSLVMHSRISFIQQPKILPGKLAKYCLIRHWSVTEHNASLSVWPGIKYWLRYFQLNSADTWQHLHSRCVCCNVIYCLDVKLHINHLAMATLYYLNVIII